MWTQLPIAGRPADVFTPAGRPQFLLVFLSDLDEITPRDNPVWSGLFAAHRFACVCPAGAETWWLDRVWPPFDPAKSAEAYLLDDVIPAALQQFGLPATAV